MHYTKSCAGISLSPSEGERAGERSHPVWAILPSVSRPLELKSELVVAQRAVQVPTLAMPVHCTSTVR